MPDVDFTINSRVRDRKNPEREGTVADVSFAFGYEVMIHWDDAPPMKVPDWQPRDDVEAIG